MFKAHDADGKWVKAENALRGSQYFCPVCRDNVFPVLGSSHKIDHFRHRPESACSYGAGETIEHAEKKLSLFDGLRSDLGDNNVRIEYRLDDGQRPDVYFEVKGQGVAVEIQHSAIGDKELADRTASYANKGVAALWIADNIRTMVNAIHISDATGLARIPRYVRRIAGMTNDVVFDQYKEGERATDVVSIKLQPKRVIDKDAHGNVRLNAEGMAIMKVYWPWAVCKLQEGTVSIDRDEYGWRRMLWLPTPISGDKLLSARPVRQQQRRQVADDIPDLVDCDRLPIEVQPIPIMHTATGSQFDSILRQFWADRRDLSREQKLWMWGYA